MPQKKIDLPQLTKAEERVMKALWQYEAPLVRDIISAMPERLTGSLLTVADGTGRVVLTQKLSANSVQRIEISKLKKGLYLVRISKATGTETFKMIKE